MYSILMLMYEYNTPFLEINIPKTCKGMTVYKPSSQLVLSQDVLPLLSYACLTSNTNTRLLRRPVDPSLHRAPSARYDDICQHKTNQRNGKEGALTPIGLVIQELNALPTHE